MTRLLTLVLFAGFAPAQELLWQLYSLQDDYTGVADSFGDLNQDGREDLLVTCWPSLANGGGFSLRVLSGVDGSVLDDHNTFVARTLAGVGDFDGDGYPDYAMMWDGGGLGFTRVEIWSPHLHQQVLQLSGSRSAWFGGIIAGRVDLDGDGRSDLLVGSTHFNYPDVRAYDHSGTLLYRIPLAPFGAVVLDILGFSDIDGDGCSDFLVGGVEYTLGYSRGYIALLSGRTGSLIRVTYDQQVSDLIGYPLRLAGDMDRDGTPDYLTGNYWGGVRSLITAYSGATGAVIQQWTATTYGIGDKVIGGRDADLDGVVDVIGGSSIYLNTSSWQGRVHVFSSRDQQELMHVEPLQLTYSGNYAETLADLGVQPGSPYPVFALTERPQSFSGGYYARIQVWRCTPPGVRITGTGCSSAGFAPTIGVRRMETPAGEQSRIVLGSAPSNAFALCAVAAAAETTFAGLALPIALDPFGYPGCSLLVPAVPNAPRTVGSSGVDRGYAEVNLTRPLVATGGYSAAAQWLVFDPATSGFASTPRCEFRVQ